MVEAGFGKPANMSDSDKVHWWNEDGSMLCNSKPGTGYIGNKMRPSAVNIVEVCPQCYTMVAPLMSTVLRARR